MDHPLIAALATAEGRGGIAIIRLSGDGAWSVIEQIFQPRQPFDWSTVAGYSLHYGHITYEGAIYDEVLVALMKEHASYTREPVSYTHLRPLRSTPRSKRSFTQIGAHKTSPVSASRR